jgi:hypothetical protein
MWRVPTVRFGEIVRVDRRVDRHQVDGGDAGPTATLAKLEPAKPEF